MDSVPLTPERIAAADCGGHRDPPPGRRHRGASSPTRGWWSTCATPCARRSTAPPAAPLPPTSTSSRPAGPPPSVARRAVWIDLTNSPHVLFFRPILRRLDEAGVPSVVTARDFAQTLGLLELYGIPHTVIGRHGGARLGGKVTGPRASVAGADPVRARDPGHPAGGQPRLQRPGRRREAAAGCTARCSTTSRAPPRCTGSTSGWRTR